MPDTDIDMQDAPATDRHSDAGTTVSLKSSKSAKSARSANSVQSGPSQSDAPFNANFRGHHNLHRRRSVYDVVAGRVRIRDPRPPKWPGQPIKYRHAQLAPEEALFRAANAPDRYEETDTYFAHEKLADGMLPPSDLIKAVHHYASNFYEALHKRHTKRSTVKAGTTVKTEKNVKTETAIKSEPETVVSPAIRGRVRDRARTRARPRRRRLVDERSMDETALLAFGILLEEAGRAVLGADGALVLTEDAEGSREDEDEEEEEEEGSKDAAKEGAKAKEAKVNKKKAGTSGKKKTS
ncbi:hypothetical protein SEUCBS139899_001177 [Sporothrix eucalyptigena]|uniref:Uncharacterized protein n=1 Tax=Sporothrix eucalyptigena TaxID=1812306 RepID=A0ABP0D1K1_9PEZI